MKLKDTIILVFVIGLFTSSAALANERLLFSVDLIRHGDRNPLQEIPSAPYAWKEGIGELTIDGIYQEFQLGVELRKKYIEQNHLLPPNYDPKTMYVSSTDMDRTLVSAEAILLGLYPLGTGPYLPSGTPALPAAFQPIPIHIDPEESFSPKFDKHFFRMLKYYLYTKFKWKMKTFHMHDTLNAWQQLTGVDVYDPYQLAFLGDNLYIRLTRHIPLPHDMTPQQATEIFNLGKWVYIHLVLRKEITYFIGHHYLSAMADYLKKVTQQSSPLRYVLFLGHDLSIVAVMMTLHVAKLDDFPKFGSVFNISLFEDDHKNQLIRISYNNQPLFIPACGGTVCTLDQFYRLVK